MLEFIAGVIVGGAAFSLYRTQIQKTDKHLQPRSGTRRTALPSHKPRVIVQTDEKAAVIELERAKQQGWDPVSSV